MTRTRSDTSAADAAMGQSVKTSEINAPDAEAGVPKKLIPGKFARVMRSQIKAARSIAFG
jgi:hypothetical protein